MGIMRKQIAEDSDRKPFFIARDDSAPREHRYTITGALPAPIVAPTIPDAMTQLRAYMRNHGRCLLTYDLHAGTIVCNDVTGEIMERMKSR